VHRTLQLLHEENKTVIVIAHRLSTINMAQRIIVLYKGEIVQDGTFAELSVTDGPFRKMWRHQTVEIPVTIET
jgi:ABC-type multidrug transport system fused ATPase/permease subunit